MSRFPLEPLRGVAETQDWGAASWAGAAESTTAPAARASSGAGRSGPSPRRSLARQPTPRGKAERKRR